MRIFKFKWILPKVESISFNSAQQLQSPEELKLDDGDDDDYDGAMLKY